jgi:ABC-type cobalt transport system substrate-binding protein
VAAFRDVFIDHPAANLTVNRFGNFTAYFRALLPPVPAEFTISLFTIFDTALVGSLLIPAAIGWIKSKKQDSRLQSR